MAVNITPVECAKMVEYYLGSRMAKPLIQLFIIVGLLGFIGWTGSLFLGFINTYIWPYFSGLFANGGVNINAATPVLTIVIALFATAYAIAVYIFARAFKRRAVPQDKIDALAELRSEGVSIYAEHPKDTEVPAWQARWEAWCKKVTDFLGKNFTRAEELYFSRLGVIDPGSFAHAANEVHLHKLLMLKKQLKILEDLITRHLDRH